MIRPLIGVYGATGHTGRLVARELARRGHDLRLGARRGEGLVALADELDAEAGIVACSDVDGVDRFASGLGVLVNCAGPFGPTALPLAAAALAAGAHYVDTSGEPPVVEALIDGLDAFAHAHRRVIAPAVGFFGALPTLLARAAAGDEDQVDRVRIAYALEGWRMTPGSRAAAASLAGRRHVFRDGALAVETGAPQIGTWRFEGMWGEVPMLRDYPSPEIVLLGGRLARDAASAVMTLSTIEEIRANPGWHDVDEAARAQTRFTVEAEIRRGNEVALASAEGTDIYGVTAPLVADVVDRLIAGGVAPGVRAADEILDTPAELQHLPGVRLTLPHAPGSTS